MIRNQALKWECEEGGEWVLMAPDEVKVLEVYRRAKALGYADIAISVQEGARTKLWLTEKMR